MAKFCKKCNAQIPRKVFVNGKEHLVSKRIYCTGCSPLFSKKQYLFRKEETLKKHSNDQSNLAGNKVCPICNKVFKYTKNDVCSTCRNFYSRHKCKIKCVEHLGGKCISCGNQDIDVLTCHHRERKEKKFNLSANLNSISWEKIKQELNKCDLLCMNCHMKYHKNELLERRTKLAEYYSNKRSK